MIAVIQRVSSASVDVDGERIADIGPGFLVLAGLLTGDSAADLDFIASKIARLRVFADELGKMNLSLAQVGKYPQPARALSLHGPLSHHSRHSISFHRTCADPIRPPCNGIATVDHGNLSDSRSHCLSAVPDSQRNGWPSGLGSRITHAAVIPRESISR